MSMLTQLPNLLWHHRLRPKCDISLPTASASAHTWRTLFCAVLDASPKAMSARADLVGESLLW